MGRLIEEAVRREAGKRLLDAMRRLRETNVPPLTEEEIDLERLPLLGPGGFLVHLSVDTSSADLMDLCKDVDAFYIDTVCEPWPGLYANANATISERSNYALRDTMLKLKPRFAGGPTAVIAHGANPGLVSHFVKQALLNIATEHYTATRWGEATAT